jgi:hypothetical protein
VTDDPRKLGQIIDAWIDGSIDANRFELLSQAIKRDPETAKAAARRAMLHCELRRQMVRHVVPPAVGRPQRLRRPPMNAWIGGAAAAVVLIAAALMTAMLPPTAAEPGRAIVTQLNDVTWTGFAAGIGDDVAGKPLALTTGTIGIEFSGGSRITITGPAMLTIEQADRVMLSRGRLAADARPGFQVDAPGGVSVVDLGTRFNMRVDESAATHVVVVEGAVSMVVHQPGRSAAAAVQRIVAGEAGTAEAGQGITRHPAGSHPGETLAITSHPADGSVYHEHDLDRLGEFDVQNLIIGSAAGPADYSGVLMLPLPDRNGMVVGTAVLELPVVMAGSLPGAGVDVWVLGYVRGPARLNPRWLLSADADARTNIELGVNPTSGRPVKVIDNLIAPGEPVEVGDIRQTDAAQSAALAATINALYDSGAKPGDYLVIRLNSDQPLADRFDGVTPERAFRNIRFGASHQEDPHRRSKLRLTLTVR